tara:strand:- start:80 stop:217 length:138 start_codon:yes stop_codon:yes gene_type:complete
MTDDEVREALKLALDAWEAAKRQAEAADEEREYLDAVMYGEDDWA